VQNVTCFFTTPNWPFLYIYDITKVENSSVFIMIWMKPAMYSELMYQGLSNWKQQKSEYFLHTPHQLTKNVSISIFENEKYNSELEWQNEWENNFLKFFIAMPFKFEIESFSFQYPSNVTCLSCVCWKKWWPFKYYMDGKNIFFYWQADQIA
jgi:hypothetical protein